MEVGSLRAVSKILSHGLLFFPSRFVEDEGRRTDRYNGAFFDPYLFFLPDKDVAQECPGKAWEIAQCVNELSFLVFLYINNTVFTAHAGVARDDGDVDSVGVFVAAADHVVAHDKGQFLLEAERVLDYRDIAAGEVGFFHFFLLAALVTNDFAS